jgi:hypothetical protein
MQENVQRINLHHLAMFNTEMTHLFLAFWCDLPSIYPPSPLHLPISPISQYKPALPDILV